MFLQAPPPPLSLCDVKPMNTETTNIYKKKSDIQGFRYTENTEHALSQFSLLVQFIIPLKTTNYVTFLMLSMMSTGTSM